MNANGGPPEPIAQLIREHGAVLDMPFTQSIYQPLLASQRRDGVTSTLDLPYGTHERHRLDVYRPVSDSAAARPALIFMHGGGFVRGDKSNRENVGQYFARNGFVTLVPNYRLAPANPWPAGAEDVVRAFCWAREHAAGIGADVHKIFIAGESAGAAHVALAALARRFQLPGDFAGVVLISGVYDVRLEALARRQFGIATPDPRNDAYFGTDFERFALMSTIEMIDAAPFPLLITYAELDLLQMQVQAGALFARLVTQHRFAPELNVVRGHNHLTQVYAINTGDESLGRPMVQFLNTHS
jgi:acetyl esterase